MNKFYSIFFLFFLIACKVNELEYSLMKANEYAQKGEYEKALEFAKNASKGAPKNTKAIELNSKIYASIADAFYLKKDCKSAKINAKKAIDLFPENDSAYNTMAACLMLYGNYRQSIPYSLMDRKLRPHSSTPNHNLAVAYRELKDFQNAIIYYHEAVEKGSDPKSQLSERISLVELYRKIGDLSKSQIELDKFEALINNPEVEPFKKDFIERFEYSKDFLSKNLKTKNPH